MSKLFFVSYNKNDTSWAEWVSWIVEDIGCQVVIQAWDFIPGKSWVQEMHDASKKCDALICILSNDFLNSGFTTAEWQTEFVKDPTGKERKIIPIRVRDCKPDGLLGTRIYIDLVGKNREDAKELVKQAILGGRRKPNNEPDFPADHGKEPTYPTSTIKYAFVLDGEYSESAKEKVENLLRHIQKNVKDASITITEISEGSMILHLESSYDVFRQLKQKFMESDDFEVDGLKVLGIWLIDDTTKDPVNYRLEFYRDRLIKYFLSEGADIETAKDLSQDVILNIYSDPLKYKYLSSTSLIASMVKITFEQCVVEKDREALVRKKYKNAAGDINWDEVYKASLDVLNRLSNDDQFILEQYWDSRFAEGKFDHIRGDDIEEQVNSQVQTFIQEQNEED